MQNETIRLFVACAQRMLVVLLFSLLTAVAVTASPVNIAILTDGPSSQTDDVVRHLQMSGAAFVAASKMLKFSESYVVRLEATR